MDALMDGAVGNIGWMSGMDWTDGLIAWMNVVDG